MTTSSSKMLVVSASTLVAILVGAGCAADAAALDPQPRPMTDAERRELQAAWGTPVASSPRAAHAADTAVAAGPAPLAYLAVQPADVWVTDDTGRRWGPVPVRAGAAVRVAGPTGIAIGAATLDKGPLPDGRTYTIHVGSPADSEWQTREVEGPKPRFTPRYVDPQ